MKTKDVWIIFAICFFVFLLKYQGFPISNSLEQIPLIMHEQNPEMFKNDFFVNVSQGFNYRGNFAKLVAFVDIPFGNLEFTYMLLLFISIFVFSLGFYSLMLLITRNKELSLVSIIFPLIVFTSKISVVHAFEMSNYLTPAKAAWAIIIWGLYFYFKEKYELSFLLIGLSSFFHVTVSTLMFGIFFLSMIFIKKYKEIRKSLIFYFIPFIVFNFNLILGELSNKSGNSNEIFDILVFRAPGHFAIFNAPIINWIISPIFLLFSLVVFFKFSEIELKYKKIFIIFLIGILLYFAVGIVFVEFFPWLFVMKLQLFRIFEFLNILEFIFISEFFYNYFYGRLNKKIKALLIVLIAILIIAYTFYNPIFERGNFSKEESELFSYIQVNTPKDSIILTPPYHGIYRIGTQRAIVIDKKSEPLSEEALIEWNGRFMDITNNITDSSPSEGRKGYDSLTKEQVIELSKKYNFSYAVFEKPKTLDLPLFYENERYNVYELTINSNNS